MVGYTPSISTAVWMGTASASPISNADGRDHLRVGLPGAIWQEFMNAVLDGTPEENLPDKAIIEGDTGEGVRRSRPPRAPSRGATTRRADDGHGGPAAVDRTATASGRRRPAPNDPTSRRPTPHRRGPRADGDPDPATDVPAGGASRRRGPTAAWQPGQQVDAGERLTPPAD